MENVWISGGVCWFVPKLRIVRVNSQVKICQRAYKILVEEVDFNPQVRFLFVDFK